ncbi:PREDICTED: uncharacterized protein LOC105597903 [Cercocebus atys]|uniref:uncharacterized protein LOC105597903 n=1 Tax=Cercocebus atys TaxID=9531 RepID=UPI0005F5143A|nr:PREDICTED: uncharacterized protein LOC105597903 [Cercocebus atys]
MLRTYINFSWAKSPSDTGQRRVSSFTLIIVADWELHAAHCRCSAWRGSIGPHITSPGKEQMAKFIPSMVSMEHVSLLHHHNVKKSFLTCRIWEHKDDMVVSWFFNATIGSLVLILHPSGRLVQVILFSPLTLSPCFSLLSLLLFLSESLSRFCLPEHPLQFEVILFSSCRCRTPSVVPTPPHCTLRQEGASVSPILTLHCTCPASSLPPGLRLALGPAPKGGHSPELQTSSCCRCSSEANLVTADV